jgi:solute carrier family 44 protein 1 (choline transporter-like protein)
MGCCGDDSDDDKKKELKGPIEDRSCTDIIFFVLFIVFWVGMFIIAGIAIDKGDPHRLIYGVDSWGNVCGKDNVQRIANNNSGLDLSDHKYLYYHNPGASTALKLCVTACPSANVVSCATPSNCAGYCLDNNLPYTLAASVGSLDNNNNGCPTLLPFSLYESEPRFGLRYCLPVVCTSLTLASVGE